MIILTSAWAVLAVLWAVEGSLLQSALCAACSAIVILGELWTSRK